MAYLIWAIYVPQKKNQIEARVYNIVFKAYTLKFFLFRIIF